eukprot:TRINITY_DN39257_c0_g1_i1.p1 TRINITY_DN39257_c0_g1~~TRINITY_DN39257_c0_g1_i1.p1  ORF type:complete len:730 (+),score=130.62 TRINITY_DN39257_c0_g1_i1:134-2191(+)
MAPALLHGGYRAAVQVHCSGQTTEISTHTIRNSSHLSSSFVASSAFKNNAQLKIVQKDSAPHRRGRLQISGVTGVATREPSPPKVAEKEKLGSSTSQGNDSETGKRPLRVLVAGGGIGGLVFALAAKKRGLDVTVFERDLTAIRGEGQYRGPIQIQSNALAALEAVDTGVAEAVMEGGCVTGDRINGLVDGLTGEWYIKFDTFTPAVEKGLPITRVISRMALQEILAQAVGTEIIKNGTKVVDFQDDGKKVTVTLEDGARYEGDILVGADGINSKVRAQLLGKTEAVYSDYTCYTGIADFTPPDLDTVGYRVFLGNRQYFVSSDVGHGKMQWYAFYNEPPDGSDKPGERQQRVLELFGHWCDKVVDLIKATPEDMILRRDIYDRIPIMQWSRGRTTLLGDSAHAMQPNLGQGGCMAIEDGYQLALDLDRAAKEVEGDYSKLDLPAVLRSYESERRMRVGAIHGLARMAAIMASTYKAYLGEGLGPLSWITKFKIPHPGKVGGGFVMKYTMPLVMQWVLGGNNSLLMEDRVPYCRLQDKAKGDLQLWLEDDDALERATNAEWLLMHPTADGVDPSPISLPAVNGGCTVFGSCEAACIDAAESSLLIAAAVLDVPEVCARHAKIECKDGLFYVTDLGSVAGTWYSRVDGKRSKLVPQVATRLHPGDTLEFGSHPEAKLRIKLRALVK